MGDDVADDPYDLVPYIDLVSCLRNLCEFVAELPG